MAYNDFRKSIYKSIENEIVDESSGIALVKFLEMKRNNEFPAYSVKVAVDFSDPEKKLKDLNYITGFDTELSTNTKKNIFSAVGMKSFLSGVNEDNFKERNLSGFFEISLYGNNLIPGDALSIKTLEMGDGDELLESSKRESNFMSLLGSIGIGNIEKVSNGSSLISNYSFDEIAEIGSFSPSVLTNNEFQLGISGVGEESGQTIDISLQVGARKYTSTISSMSKAALIEGLTNALGEEKHPLTDILIKKADDTEMTVGDFDNLENGVYICRLERKIEVILEEKDHKKITINYHDIEKGVIKTAYISDGKSSSGDDVYDIRNITSSLTLVQAIKGSSDVGIVSLADGCIFKKSEKIEDEITDSYYFGLIGNKDAFYSDSNDRKEDSLIILDSKIRFKYSLEYGYASSVNLEKPDKDERARIISDANDIRIYFIAPSQGSSVVADFADRAKSDENGKEISSTYATLINNNVRNKNEFDVDNFFHRGITVDQDGQAISGKEIGISLKDNEGSIVLSADNNIIDGDESSISRVQAIFKDANGTAIRTADMAHFDELPNFSEFYTNGNNDPDENGTRKLDNIILVDEENFSSIELGDVSNGKNNIIVLGANDETDRKGNYRVIYSKQMIDHYCRPVIKVSKGIVERNREENIDNLK